MVLLVLEKFKFPFGIEVHKKKSRPLPSSLRDFRREISSFASQFLLETVSSSCLERCFQLIHATNNAFTRLVVEIDYPLGEWGAKAIEQYLSDSLNLLDLLNAISSRIFHLNQSKFSNLYALRVADNSPSSAAYHFIKIPETTFNLGKVLEKENWFAGSEEKSKSKKESTVLEALTVVRRIGFLTLGLVLSCLSNDAKGYGVVRKFIAGSEESLMKSLDPMLSQEIIKMNDVMQEVNASVDRLSADKSAGERNKAAWEEMKNRLEMLESSIEAIEKQSNNLFSEVLATRSGLVRQISSWKTESGDNS